MNNRDLVVLVDQGDNQIGVENKIIAHKNCLMHRAFSVFVTNSKGEFLIQKRASSKYHSGGLWSNSCCSHPMPGESLDEAVSRRLNEEVGFCCPTKKVFEFSYKAELDGGLFENEYDHVFWGRYDGEVLFDRSEVEDYKWCTLDFLLEDARKRPDKYTFWLRRIISEFYHELREAS